MKYRKFSWGGQQSGNIPGVLPATQTQFIPVGQGGKGYTPDLKNFYQEEKPEQQPKKLGLDEETKKFLNGKGHTNANKLVIGEAEQAMNQANKLIDMYGSNALQLDEYKRLANKSVVSFTDIQKLDRDVKNTDELRKSAEKNNSLSELATTAEGHYAVKDVNNNVIEITPEQYFKDKSKYQLLSITDLLHEKDINPTLTFANVSKFSDQVVGYNLASKHLEEAFKNLGSYGFKNDNEFYQTLQNAMFKMGKGESHENNLAQLDSRFKSFLQTMPSVVMNHFKNEATKKTNSVDDRDKLAYQGLFNFMESIKTKKDEYSKKIDYDAGLTKFKLGRDTEVDVPKTDYFFDLLHATGKVQTEEIDIPNGFKPQNQDNTKVDLRNQSMYKAQVTTIPPNEEIRKQLKVFEGKTMSQIKGQKVMWNGQEIDLSKMKDADKILLSSVGEQLVRMPDPNDKLNIQLQNQINALTIKEKEFTKKAKSWNQQEAKLAAQQLPIIQSVIKELETAKLPSVYVAYNVAAPSSAFSNNSTFQYYDEKEGKLENAIGGFGEKINKPDLFKNEENSEVEKSYKEKFGDSGLGMTGTNDLYTTTVYIKQNNIHYADPTSIRTGYMDALNQANELRERLDKAFRTPPSAQLP